MRVCAGGGSQRHAVSKDRHQDLPAAGAMPSLHSRSIRAFTVIADLWMLTTTSKTCDHMKHAYMQKHKKNKLRQNVKQHVNMHTWIRTKRRLVRTIEADVGGNSGGPTVFKNV